MINHHAALIYTMVIMSAADRDMSDAELGAMAAVSYTHLTLPTILRV